MKLDVESSNGEKVIELRLRQEQGDVWLDVVNAGKFFPSERFPILWVSVSHIEMNSQLLDLRLIRVRLLLSRRLHEARG